MLVSVLVQQGWVGQIGFYTMEFGRKNLGGRSMKSGAERSVGAGGVPKGPDPSWELGRP